MSQSEESGKIWNISKDEPWKIWSLQSAICQVTTKLEQGAFLVAIHSR